MVICVVVECNSRQGRPYVFINFLQLFDAPFKPNPKKQKKIHLEKNCYISGNENLHLPVWTLRNFPLKICHVFAKNLL